MNKRKIIYLLLCLFVLLSGCKRNQVEKQLPVYLGMVVSSDVTNVNYNSDHNRTNIIDPFDRFDGITIIDKVKLEIGADKTEMLDFYVDLETPMFLTVKLFNPEKYEILSVIINGTKYQKHQFEESSDFDNIKIKLFSGPISGVKEFRLTEILFYNGKSINEIEIVENEIIKIGVNYEKEPSMKVVSTEINATSMFLDVLVSDYDKVISDNDGILQVVLYDGVNLIQKYNLKDGTNKIVFDKLMINTLYQYAIYSYCDLLNGEEKKLKILAHDTFVTEDIIEMKDVVGFVDSVSFNLIINDVDKVGNIKSIELYQNDKLIKTLSNFNEFMFHQLDSNTEYLIKVTYLYDIGTKHERVVESSFTTIKKTPALQIIINSLSQDSFDFSLIVVDKDDAGSLIKMELYKDNNLLIELENNSVRGLQSNTKYLIKAFYKYNVASEDLVMIFEYNVTTLSKEVPVIDIIIDNLTQDRIKFDIFETDVDEVGQIEMIELYHEGILLKSYDDLLNMEFNNLYSNNTYLIKMTYSYDLNDGLGERLIVLEREVTTLSKAVPVIDIVIKDVTQDRVTFDIIETDIDKVGQIEKIELYREGKLVTSCDLLNREFIDLYSNNTYKIEIIYSYDLNDGLGSRPIYLEGYVTTLAKAVPVVELVIEDITQDRVTFDILETDNDKVGHIEKIELYREGNLVKSCDLLNREFIDLYSNNTYIVKMTYIYDLNDGIGNRQIDLEKEVTTLPKEVPVLDVVIKEVTQDSVSFDISETDNDRVGNIEKIEIYHDDILINSTDMSNLIFRNLLSNNTYQIKIRYIYDLNDGLGLRQIVLTEEVHLLEKATPIVSFGEVIAYVNSISFNYDVIDVDKVGYVKKIQLYNNLELEQEFVEADLNCFTDLLSNSLYTIKIIYEYDLNDGTGVHEITIYTTKATQAEEIVITGCTVLNTATPKINEEIHLRILFKNPSSILIDSFIINNELVKVVSTNTVSSAIVKLTPESDGGIFEINIEGVKFSSYGTDIWQDVKETFIKEVLILGEINAINIYNEESNMIGLLDENQFLFIEIDNPTQYFIFSLTIKINQSLFTYSSNEIQNFDNRYLRINFPNSINTFSEVYHVVELESISYGLNFDEQKELALTNVSNSFAIMKSLVARDILTIDDLINLEDGYIYNLKSDLDLSTNPWLPKSFNGILYGNGYEIKNMSIVIDNESIKDQYFGLFSSFSGKIEGVILSDIYISIKTKGNVYFGGICGMCNNSIIIDTNVTGIIYIDTTAIVIADGLIGNSSSSVLSNSTFSGTISIKGINM